MSIWTFRFLYGFGGLKNQYSSVNLVKEGFLPFQNVLRQVTGVESERSGNGCCGFRIGIATEKHRRLLAICL